MDERDKIYLRIKATALDRAMHNDDSLSQDLIRQIEKRKKRRQKARANVISQMPDDADE